MALISAGGILVLSHVHVSSTQAENLFPVPQTKNSIWSLGDSKPRVFSPLERAFSCPHPVCDAWLQKLSNRRAAKGLPRTSHVYGHWVQDSYLEQPPVAYTLKTRKVWLKTLKALA